MKNKAQPSLARAIFLCMFITFTALVILLTLTLSSLFYHSAEDKSVNSLKSRAESVAQKLNVYSEAEQIEILKSQLDLTERITLVSKDGKVLFDSEINPDEMANHASRPEIIEATKSGEAVVMRTSDTLHQDLVYVAIALKDGSIIRFSEYRQSFFDFLNNTSFAIALMLIFLIIALFYLTRFLTKRIMKPISEVDIFAPLADSAYREMRPLFERIDEQRSRLRLQNKELHEAANLRRVFSSNVSHEMKTPLQVISGYAELIENGITDEQDTQKFAGLIGQEAKSMRKLIDDILTLSRLDEAGLGEELQQIDVVELVARTCSRLTPIANENNVAINIEGTCSNILGHALLLEEAVYNLVENAIRYNVSGGSVTINLSADAALGQITIRIKDTGCGIPEDKQSKIFERFYRLDESRSKETGGTGLGLAIVKHVVDVHGGTIDIESALEKGSTFTVVLPNNAEKK